MKHQFGVGQYETRSGDTAVVLRKVTGGLPLIGYTVCHHSGIERGCMWNITGNSYYEGRAAPNDLMLPQPWTLVKKPTLTRFSHDNRYAFDVDSIYDVDRLLAVLNAGEEALQEESK